MEINVLIDEKFEGSLDAGWLEHLLEQILIAQAVSAKTELSLVIVGQEKIHELNLKYLERDEPTDVLSFAMLAEPAGDAAPFILPPDGMQHLGEVIISYPQAVIQAGEHRHTVKKEMALLIIHGVLHLVGYDHDQPEVEQEMRAREAEILGHLEGELV